MNFDPEYYAQNVDEWCNDDDFIEAHTRKQIITILDRSILSGKQFHKIFSIATSFFEQEDIISMLEHSHVDFNNQIENISKVLEFFGFFFNLQIFYDMRSGLGCISLNTGTNEDKVLPNNIKELEKCQKSEFYFDEIYRILAKAASQNDEQTIKYAIDNKYTEVRDGYIKSGADVALWSAMKGNMRLTNLLAKNGVNMTTRDQVNASILHLFCIKGNSEAIKFALKFIDKNDVDNNGWTPLHYAAYYNNSEACRYLCSLPGIDLYAYNNSNRTPLAEASNSFRNCGETIEILRRSGGTF